jgi:hypothetical protein
MLLGSEKESLKTYAPMIVRLLRYQYRDKVRSGDVYRNYRLNDIAKEYFFPLFPRANSTSLFAALSGVNCYRVLFFLIISTSSARNYSDKDAFVQNCFGNDRHNLTLAPGIPAPSDEDEGDSSNDFFDLISDNIGSYRDW